MKLTSYTCECCGEQQFELTIDTEEQTEHTRQYVTTEFSLSGLQAFSDAIHQALEDTTK